MTDPTFALVWNLAYLHLCMYICFHNKIVSKGEGIIWREDGKI